MDFDRSAFKAELIATGMWVPIRVTSLGSSPMVTDGYADFRKPDNIILGQISNDQQIEFEATDFPDLDEGYRVDLLDASGAPISGRAYRVRQTPKVTDNPNDDQSGFWLCALLTKI